MSGLNLTLESSGRRIAAGEECTVGRASGNTLAFPEDETMSREHARIRRRGEAYVLSDLGTRNGSFLERGGARTRVSEVELEPGDVIVVGASRILVSAVEDEAASHTVINDPGLTSVPDPTRVGGVLPDLGGPAAKDLGRAGGDDSPGRGGGSRRRGWRRMLPGGG